MTYEVTLKSADIRHALDGEMRLGLSHQDNEVAEIDYYWDAAQFTATFHGTATDMPIPMHPVEFIARPIQAVLAQKTDAHALPSDVFQHTRIFVEIDKGKTS